METYFDGAHAADSANFFIFAEVSTKLVSEYKSKLQISEAENSRLDGMVR